MRFNILTSLLAVASFTTATTIFVTSYDGTLTTLSLTAVNGSYSLNQTAVNRDCAPSPSWLTLDANRGLLFCLNEGLTTVNGSLSSYTINQDGTLTHIQNTTTISGPVSGVIYGNPSGKRGIALAHYSGSAVSSWDLLGGGRFRLNQNIPYTLDQPGPIADRQEAPHEHEAILDPTGQYILVPDLGADLVRVYSWDVDTLDLTELAPLQAAPGSGPRHAAFWNPYGVACAGCTTFMYLVSELASTVTGYAVHYLPNGGGLTFNVVYNSSTFGYLNTPAGNAPAEVVISPDNRFLILSNRNDSSFSVPNIDFPANQTAQPSDSLSTFALNHDGTLTFRQLAPAYGSFPRHFSLNAVGNLVGVGQQESSEVTILSRDVVSGSIGEAVARIHIGGQVTNVVFDEEKPLGHLGG